MPPIYVLKAATVVSFAVFSVMLVFQQAPSTYNKSISRPKVQAASVTIPGSPMRLTIPTIKVDATIQHVSVSPKGEMEVPSNTIDVAWFKLGSRPGEPGSAVISGHLDGKNREAGVFTNLDKLKKGDMLYIEDSTGTLIAFVVQESRTYDPGYADEVFSPSDVAHLNLITCTGVWDGEKKTYSKRLVVFADIAP